MSAETSRDRIATAIDIASANCLIGVAGIIRDLAAERDAATARAEAAEARCDLFDTQAAAAKIAAANAEAQRDAATAERDRLREVAEEFVRRVEAGEIRSRRSYAAFKVALTSAKEPSA